MYQRDTWGDVRSSVRQALHAQLDLLDEAALVQQSNALLATLPRSGGDTPATAALFLQRYHTRLQQELCRGTETIPQAATVEDELGRLTRAVLLTVGIGEGLSIEAAVSLAFVLYKRGAAAFCAAPP